MTMVHDQHLPMTATQLVGHTASSVVGGLTTPAPWMLGVVLLNMIGIAAGVYFLNLLIKGQQSHLANLLDVQKSQITMVLNTHDREFDALMAMVREFEKMPVLPPPAEEIPMPLPKP
jgi:hypothetical protein